MTPLSAEHRIFSSKNMFLVHNQLTKLVAYDLALFMNYNVVAYRENKVVRFVGNCCSITLLPYRRSKLAINMLKIFVRSMMCTYAKEQTVPIEIHFYSVCNCTARDVSI